MRQLDGTKTAPLFEATLAIPDYNELIHGELLGIENLRGEKALPLLEKLYQSCNEKLRINVVKALGHLPGEKSRGMIESRLSDPSEYLWICLFLSPYISHSMNSISATVQPCVPIFSFDGLPLTMRTRQHWSSARL
ncbi:MAG: hypothetical protein JWN58_334 [Gammaproteobacteria bacterium]|nr:hypothetical protein [Gammaproteobacteria bacterium]